MKSIQNEEKKAFHIKDDKIRHTRRKRRKEGWGGERDNFQSRKNNGYSYKNEIILLIMFENKMPHRLTCFDIWSSVGDAALEVGDCLVSLAL